MSREDSDNTGSAQPSRRVWLTSLAALGFGSILGGRTPAAAQGAIAISEDEMQRFIEEAFEMKRQASAAGDQAYGAVVVKDNRIVGAAPSRVVTNTDPTAHAEMEALRDAAAKLGRRDLSGCVLFSSSPPCPMCEAAAYWANIQQLHYGDPVRDGGAPSLCGC